MFLLHVDVHTCVFTVVYRERIKEGPKVNLRRRLLLRDFVFLILFILKFWHFELKLFYFIKYSDNRFYYSTIPLFLNFPSQYYMDSIDVTRWIMVLWIFSVKVLLSMFGSWVPCFILLSWMVKIRLIIVNEMDISFFTCDHSSKCWF